MAGQRTGVVPPSLGLDQTWDALVAVAIPGFETWNLPRWEWRGGTTANLRQGDDSAVQALTRHPPGGLPLVPGIHRDCPFLLSGCPHAAHFP